MAKRAKAVSKTKKVFIIVGIVIAVLICGAFIMMGFDYGLLSDDSVIVPVDREDGKINVLLLGVDVEGLRTDAIMVASYDIKENKVNMLSIPRDTRMYIGSRYQKINAAHAIGGMKGKIAGPEGTVEAVTRLTGIPINYYIEFSFAAIDHFSEAIGPVTFNVPDVEGNGRGMNYEDPVQDLKIHLKPGEQELVGNEVQQLLRYRKSMYKDKNGNRLGYGDGDRGRVQMQQDFIKAVVDQKLNAGLILKLPEIFSNLSNDIKTNLSIADIAKYAKYLQGFSSENISTYQLPGEGKMIGGGSYWVCDLEATKTLIEDVFGYDASNITIDSPDGKKKSSDSEKADTSDKKSESTNKKTTSTPKPSSDDNHADDDDVDDKLVTKSTPTPSVKETEKPKTTKAPEKAESGEPSKSDTESTDKSDKTPVSDNEKTDAKEPEKTSAPEKEKPAATKAPARPTANPEVNENAVSID